MHGMDMADWVLIGVFSWLFHLWKGYMGIFNAELISKLQYKFRRLS